MILVTARAPVIGVKLRKMLLFQGKHNQKMAHKFSVHPLHGLVRCVQAGGAGL